MLNLSATKIRLFGLIFVLLCVVSSAHASRRDTLCTTYKSGTYHTCCIRSLKADAAKADSLVDLLIYQFRTDPDLLFEWVFKGLGNEQKQKERKEVQLHFAKTEFDPLTSVGTLWMNVEVPGVKTFKDVPVKSKIVKKLHNDFESTTTMDILYSSSLLKKANGTLLVKNDNGIVTLQFDCYVTFGWFFNIFVTNRRYRNLIEWRVKGMIDNFKETLRKA